MISLGNDEKALENLQIVVTKFPGSSYVRKALVSIAQTHYNAGKDDEALLVFNKIIKDYPNFEDSREALIGIKNIYIDRGKASEYDALINDLGFVDFSESARDSLYYEAAESQYFDANCKESVESFTKYLNMFDKPLFGLNARFYRAECLMKMGQAKESLRDYKYVVDQPKNKFTESSLVYIARNAYDNQDCPNALGLYKRLALIAEHPENAFEAEIGQMRCNYELNNYQGAISNAIIALESEKANAKLRDEANLIIAKSNLQLGNNDESKQYLEKVIANRHPVLRQLKRFTCNRASCLMRIS